MPSAPTAHRRPTRRRRRHRAAAVGCVLALASITSAAQATTPAGGPSLPAAERSSLQQGPPAVRLIAGGVVLALDPYSSCWFTATTGTCYDGIPPAPLPSLGGTTGPVRLAFDRSDWRFSVTMEDRSGTSRSVKLMRIGPQRWRLALASLPDGRYRSDVFGRGPQGDVAAAFVVTVR